MEDLTADGGSVRFPWRLTLVDLAVAGILYFYFYFFVFVLQRVSALLESRRISVGEHIPDSKRTHSINNAGIS